MMFYYLLITILLSNSYLFADGFDDLVKIQDSFTSKYTAVFKDFEGTNADKLKNFDISQINRCQADQNCDYEKANTTLNYVASVAMANDYVNNIKDKIEELKEYKDREDYKDLRKELKDEKMTDDEIKELNKVMDAYIEYLESLAKDLSVENAKKRLPLLSDQEKKRQQDIIGAYKSETSQKLQSLQSVKSSCGKACSYSGSEDLMKKISKEVAGVKYTQKTGDDLYNQLSNKTLEACKGGSKDVLCSFVSSRQALAFVSGNPVGANVITKYSDKNCPLLTRILQENNVKPLIQTACLGQMNKAYTNQMANGTSGLTKTLGHVNFARNLCPEMAQDPFIQKFNLSAAGTGMTGMPSSFDLAAGTGATIPNQNLLAYNVGAGNSWFNPMWNASNYNVNVNNLSPGTVGGGSVKLDAGNASNFYNDVSGGYSNWGNQANKNIPKISSQYNAVSSYNSDLSKNMINYSNNNVAAQTYTKSANDIYKLAAGGSGSSYTDPVIAIRTQISDVQAQRSELNDEIISLGRKGLMSNHWREFLIKFGNVQEASEAVTASARFSSLLTIDSILQFEITRLEDQLIGCQGHGNNQICELFDINNMYVQNGKEINIRKTKIKTPLDVDINKQYKVKPEWRANLMALSKEMLKKAEQAKRSANIYKSNIQKLLKKKTPILSVNDLPSLDMLRYEMKNMEAWKKAGIKNMKMIDKAIADNKNKKVADNTTKEAETLKSSMNNMVTSIDNVRGSVNKMHELVSDLYVEVPRTQELQIVAKQMVEQGL